MSFEIIFQKHKILDKLFMILNIILNQSKSINSLTLFLHIDLKYSLEKMSLNKLSLNWLKKIIYTVLLTH